MKKIWIFLKNLIIFVYILLIIFVTICLLSYNDYKVSVFGSNTIIPIIDEDLEPDFTVGDLVIVEKNKISSVKEGDVIFFYRTSGGETTINYATVTNVEIVTDTEATFTVEGEFKFSSSYFIGKTDTATIIPNVGKILTILESKWGFLFLGVLPSLIAFLYTLYSVVLEIKDGKEKEETPKNEKRAVSDKINNKNKVKENIDEQEINQKNNLEENVNEKEINKKNNLEENVDEKEIDKKNEEELNVLPKENTENEIIESSEKVQENEADKAISKMENKEETEKTKESNSNEKDNIEKVKKEELTEEKDTKTKSMTEEEKKKALIEAKMKSMTLEEKRALIEAKLKSMTPEEKKALIEAKRKKMEADKNKKGD